MVAPDGSVRWWEVPGGKLGPLSGSLPDPHYLTVTLDNVCHLSGLSSCTFLKEDVGQKLDLQAFLTPALGVAALGPAPGAPLDPGPIMRGVSPFAQMAS